MFEVEIKRKFFGKPLSLMSFLISKAGLELFSNIYSNLNPNVLQGPMFSDFNLITDYYLYDTHGYRLRKIEDQYCDPYERWLPQYSKTVKSSIDGSVQETEIYLSEQEFNVGITAWQATDKLSLQKDRMTFVFTYDKIPVTLALDNVDLGEFSGNYCELEILTYKDPDKAKTLLKTLESCIFDPKTSVRTNKSYFKMVKEHNEQRKTNP